MTRKKRDAGVGILAGLAAGALSLAPLLPGGGLAAQQESRQPARTEAADSARVVAFSPQSGPPGTTVTVRARELPSITPVYLTLGGTSSGFEVLGDMLITDLEGELSETVRIPTWATHDQLHLFVVMDVYFGRLTASEPFHVTGPDGTLSRKGRIERVRGGCTALRGDDSRLYAVRGAPDPLAVGERVVVEGTVATSDCPGDITIDVTRVTEVPGA